ncbi:hypothetical protein PybrP1_010317 [[Pythium] brassicae (nom. inval.)]|nr:hypothetical protein PybrP1_010317 [[Pythium] brassicae (nom. inval.)]
MAMDDPTTAAADAAQLGRRESVAIGGEQASAELARSLPELVEQLRALRTAMEKSAKVYDAISAGEFKTHQAVAAPLPPAPPVGVPRSSSEGRHSGGGASDSSSYYKYNAAGRQSIFTPFADNFDGERGSLSQPTAEQLANRHSAPLELGDLGGGVGLARHASKRGQPPPQQQQQYYQPHPARPETRRPAPARNGADYTVMWVSGECGISLRNFSKDKIGAQVAVLQQAEGVTTGIANCRLGDQLVTVNDDPVEAAAFTDIVQKLKTTRRPISLGFRTNQNLATSPVAGPRMRLVGAARNSSGRSGSGSGSAPRSFFPTEDDSRPSLLLARSSSGFPVDDGSGGGGSGRGALEERVTDTDASVRSSASTLSDEMESWCKEQEEMHSDIIVLLTETVLRCEKLQQENLDQLQNWLEVAPSMYAPPPKTSSAYTLKSYTSDPNSDSEQ